MDNRQISLVIITKNEEKNIVDCILSCKDLSDEIIVLDDEETIDNTRQIAEALGAKVYSQKFINYSHQKKTAVNYSTKEWILSLDADERLSKELYESILNWKKGNIYQEAQSFQFARLSFYCGKVVKTCGWYPDKKIRLWNRKYGKWNDNIVHEGVEVKSDSIIKELEGDLIHYTMNTVKEHWQKSKKYALLKSLKVRNNNKILLLFKFIFNPIWVFIKMFILKLGIIDFWRGWVISFISALAEVYIYYYSLIQKKVKKG